MDKSVYRKAFALLLCALCATGGLFVWNSAFILGERFHVSHVWFDMVTVVFFLGAIICSALAIKKEDE